MRPTNCFCRNVVFCLLLQIVCCTQAFSQPDTSDKTKTNDYAYGEGGTKEVIKKTYGGKISSTHQDTTPPSKPNQVFFGMSAIREDS